MGVRGGIAQCIDAYVEPIQDFPTPCRVSCRWPGNGIAATMDAPRKECTDMQRMPHGFTLVEALVTMAITALLLTAGLPSFSDLLERQRVSATTHLIGSYIASARTHAVTGREQVVLCPGSVDAGCRTDRDWSGGWILFRDPDGNRQPDAPLDVLRAEDDRGGAGSVLQATSTRPYLRYQVDGRSAHSNLSFVVCAKGRERARVVVNNTGRMRTSRSPDGIACGEG